VWVRMRGRTRKVGRGCTGQASSAEMAHERAKLWQHAGIASRRIKEWSRRTRDAPHK
jgi:hypothetical protein